MVELGHPTRRSWIRRRWMLLAGLFLSVLLAAQGVALANHLFPLFPGDPLGDCGQELDVAPDDTDATVLVSLRFLDTESLSSTTEVEVGETVTWRWVDDYCHSITSIDAPDGEGFTTRGGETEFGFEPELVRPDGDARTFSVTFDQPGTYEYVCVHHQTLGVRGTVVVGSG